MPHVRIQIRERHRLLFLLLAGLLLSILFLGKMGKGLQETVKSGGETFLWNLEASLEGDSGRLAGAVTAEMTVTAAVKEAFSSLTACVLGTRVWPPILWIVLSFTVWGTASLYLLWIYLGFSVGTLLWTVVIFGSWRGPFYFWGLIFPQYLLYIPALLLLYVACLRWNHFWRERGRYLRLSPFDPQLKLFVVRIFLGILLYGLGIWTEIAINPWILGKIFIIS